MMEYKYKIDVASIEDTETLVKFQLAMAKESEGTELDYETVREGVKAGIADDVVVYGQLCSDGVEAAFSWGQSYVPVGSKLCSLYGNAIEKDCSQRRE